MRVPLVILAILLIGVTVVCGCFNVRLPTSHEVEQIFVSDDEEEASRDLPPTTVPVIDANDLGGWRILCDECHIGPTYSSHTILAWGHRESCLAETTCLNCHGQALHRMDVRGNKQLCYECHLARDLPVKCLTCHNEEHVSANLVHEPNFLGNHGSSTRAGHECMDCHGSQAWCLACHGLPMPHEADIIDTHRDLVQGRPDICANCHGSQSCLRCHTAYGVTIELTE